MTMGVPVPAEKSEKIKDEPQKEEIVNIPPQLQKIAECESGDRHYKTNGEVVRGHVNPRDIGRYQINLTYHQDQAERMGLDLFDEEDNEEYALWLYEREGAQPWFWSKDCWHGTDTV